MTTQRNQGDNSNRGFASMDKEKQREISSKGGHASHGGTSEKKSSASSSSSGSRGGSSEQHAKAGRESHKNS